MSKAPMNYKKDLIILKIKQSSNLISTKKLYKTCLTLRINFEDIVSKILCDDIDLSNFYNIIVGATKLTYAKEISTT